MVRKTLTHVLLNGYLFLTNTVKLFAFIFIFFVFFFPTTGLMVHSAYSFHKLNNILSCHMPFSVFGCIPTSWLRINL